MLYKSNIIHSLFIPEVKDFQAMTLNGEKGLCQTVYLCVSYVYTILYKSMPGYIFIHSSIYPHPSFHPSISSTCIYVHLCHIYHSVCVCVFVSKHGLVLFFIKTLTSKQPSKMFGFIYMVMCMPSSLNGNVNGGVTQGSVQFHICLEP